MDKVLVERRGAVYLWLTRKETKQGEAIYEIASPDGTLLVVEHLAHREWERICQQEEDLA